MLMNSHRGHRAHREMIMSCGALRRTAVAKSLHTFESRYSLCRLRKMTRLMPRRPADFSSATGMPGAEMENAFLTLQSLGDGGDLVWLSSESCARLIFQKRLLRRF